MAELNERISLRAVKWLRKRTFSEFENDYEERVIRESLKKKTSRKDLKDSYNTIQNTCNSFLKANGVLKRTYKNSLTTPTDMGGRLFAGGSIQQILKEYRSVLIRDSTTDLDMQNAHVKIAKYICQKHEIPCPQLEYYCDHRDEILSKWTNKIVGKIAYLENTNNDTYNFAANGESNEVKKMLKLYADENKDIQKQLINLPGYSCIVASVPEEKKWNRNGSAMNRILCYYENQILMHCCTVLARNNIEPCTYMFDGVLIYGNYYDDFNLLNEIENYVETKLPGLNMKWSYKKHDLVHVIPNDFDDSMEMEFIPIEPLEIAQYIVKELDTCLLRKNGEIINFTPFQILLSTYECSY